MLKEHRENERASVKCSVMTVSDTRTKETDKSGKLIIQLLEAEGHSITHYDIVRDEKRLIQEMVKGVTIRQDVEAVLINGGTGISNRDVTIETIQPLFTKEIPGFGELFRMLSYQLDIGSASMLSRATAGVMNNRIVFSTPGSPKAVQLAMEKLILPELGHVLKEVTKDIDEK
ncbi:MogA/MoaB family molybdenum cofactor biosynthesis protein [Ornithinibacillus massiliensis]|uniref:Molybdenum cofactor biosynthesis protein B n=1 Tax=Ornithinibacillus massiliensis TaxID=1944633 RepID=A0ABS5MEU8_9BACI|nr:MogA/MoaB family molybdenum cofactor biosynthesis protein [Ornithinibacillus massiliensis]MBS3680283.1 MogA/MoaB family molybdenum cofactor biosynthesis protein [Ornithinibacillus massiliensis]